MIQYLITVFGPENGGKTTTVKQLASQYANKGLKVGICETDIYLKDEFIGNEWTMDSTNISIIDIYNPFMSYETALETLFSLLDIDNNNYDVVIIDTPGYHNAAKLIATMFQPLLKICDSIQALNKEYILIRKIDSKYQKTISKEYQKAIPNLTYLYETHDNIYDVIKLKSENN